MRHLCTVRHTTRLLTLALCSCLLAAAVAGAQTPPAAAPQGPEAGAAKSPLGAIDHKVGPVVGGLGDGAQINVPAGLVYADAKNARKLLEMMQNPTNGREVGIVLHPEEGWIVVFEFDDIGYVKDDEKDKLDADKILESFRAGTEASNKVREKRGWGKINIVGWEQAPHYDAQTHNLEWALKAESEGQPLINFNTRILGRKGCMSVVLVCDAPDLATTLPKFKELLKGFGYTAGNSYAEYRSGDKIAKYGLTALMVGGAAAVAAKTGLLKGLWKIIVIGAIAVGAFFKKIFGGSKDS